MSSLRWLYGILQGHKIDTDGMTPKEAFDKLDELKKAGKLTDSEAKTCEERRKKTLPTKKVVKVKMDADVQKQFDNATPKERSKIAYRYIMDHLCGKYAATDGREITISGIGADKMSHTTNETKIRVLPELARLIEAGEFESVVEAKKEGGQPHKRFTHFAYYKVSFQIGDDRFIGRLNVGIRKDGSSTLYDLNPFNKQ